MLPSRSIHKLVDVGLLTQRVRPEESSRHAAATDIQTANARLSVYLLGWALVMEAASDEHLVERVSAIAVCEVRFMDECIGVWISGQMDGVVRGFMAGWMSG